MGDWFQPTAVCLWDIALPQRGYIYSFEMNWHWSSSKPRKGSVILALSGKTQQILGLLILTPGTQGANRALMNTVNHRNSHFHWDWHGICHVLLLAF